MVFAFGIYKPQQLKHLRPDTILRRRRNIAMDLIEEIECSGNEPLKRAFIENLVDGAGVSKRTYSGRFPAFDDALVDQLHHWEPARPLRVLDAAVSDGSTSYDLFKLLDNAMGPEIRLTAADRDGHYLVIRDRHRRVIISPHGDIVQVVWPPFVFSPHDSRFLFPVNRMIRPFAFDFAMRLVERWRSKDPLVREVEINFFARDFRRLLSSDSRVNFVTWDISAPWPGESVHCLRAMNILNPGYFSLDQIGRIVGNLMLGVIEGGLLAFGSNEGPGSEVDGVIYRREGDWLAELARFGKGFRCHTAIKDRVVRFR